MGMKILILTSFFFEIKENNIIRGHNFTLVKKQSRLDVRKFSFSQRTINVWNKLSEECVHASHGRRSVGDGGDASPPLFSLVGTT